MKHNWLKGNAPLLIIFWIFGVLPWVIYACIGIILNKYYFDLVNVYPMQIVFYLYLLFPFLYFPLIYIAIWNSSSLYKRNKIWPILAKITVILGVAFLLIGAVVIIKHFFFEKDINYVINQDVNFLNKRLPMKVDPEGSLDHVTFKNNVLTYTYQLTSKERDKINTVFFILIVKPKVIEAVCKNKDLKNYLSKGVTMSYHYIDKNKDEIGDIFITKKDCK